MSLPKIEVIHDDAWDWEILVFEGKKVSEGHSLSLYDWENLFELLEIDFEIVQVKDIEKSKYYQR